MPQPIAPPPIKFPTFSIVATVVKHWPTPAVDRAKAHASTLSEYEVHYKQPIDKHHHALPPPKTSLSLSPSPSSPPLVTVAVAVAVPDRNGGGRKSPGRASPANPIHHRLLQVPSSSVYGTECAPVGPLSPTMNLTTTALPTTLTLHAPDFDMQQHPPVSRSSHPQTPPLSTSPESYILGSSPSRRHHSQSAPTPTSSIASKGQIHVKLISARGLNTSSINSRPYVVVVFENNEFVSRDPTGEDDKEVRGIATNLSRTSSSIAISALGAVGSKAAAQEAALRTRRPSPVSSSSSNSAKSSLSAPRGTRTPSNGLLGRMSAHNPVWKHEVSL